jgi:hypothetical protein
MSYLPSDHDTIHCAAKHAGTIDRELAQVGEVRLWTGTGRRAAAEPQHYICRTSMSWNCPCGLLCYCRGCGPQRKPPNLAKWESRSHIIGRGISGRTIVDTPMSHSNLRSTDCSLSTWQMHSLQVLINKGDISHAHCR